MFDADATFCAQPGRSGKAGVELASYNFAGYHLRHYAAEVFIAVEGGSRPTDTATFYGDDIVWSVEPPWLLDQEALRN